MMNQSIENSMESVFPTERQFDDDRSAGSRSIGMKSNHSMVSGKRGNDNFMMEDQFNEAAPVDNKHVGNGCGNQPPLNDSGTDCVETENAITAEAEKQVSNERQMMYKDNAARLQSILENIKNSTKTVLHEMSVYLQETEAVEKSYIRCRANTQKESQRLEQVEPDVMGATQRFQAQAQLFGAHGFANMAALLGNNNAAMSGGGVASTSIP